jgi:signal transduction histidine kinase
MVLAKFTSPRYRLLLLYALFVTATAILLSWSCPAHWQSVAMMAGLSLLLAWGVILIGVRKLRRRMHQLREAADALGRGELSQHVETLPNDDFIKLADALSRITDQLREKMEQEHRLREQLTRSEKLALIGELAAIVAHEINNPLDGLQNASRIVRRNLDNKEQAQQLLDMMDNGLYRIEMIVKRLLTMSRDEPMHLQPTRLDEVVDDAIMFVKPRLDRHGIELVIDFPREPVFALADRMQLAQALINLVINAADAMNEGGCLTISCNNDMESNKAVMVVTDTGEGIDSGRMDHIFEPFYTTKGKGSGTGLGLAVTRRIIEAHQGGIEVQSEPEVGSSFIIRLQNAPQRG